MGVMAPGVPGVVGLINGDPTILVGTEPVLDLGLLPVKDSDLKMPQAMWPLELLATLPNLATASKTCWLGSTGMASRGGPIMAASSGDTSPPPSLEPDGRLTNEFRLDCDADELPECVLGVMAPGVPLKDAVRELLRDGARDGVPDGIWLPTGSGASLVGGSMLYLSNVGVPGIGEPPMDELPLTGAVWAALDSRWSWYARACRWYCLCFDWFHDESVRGAADVDVDAKLSLSSSPPPLLSLLSHGRKLCRFLSVEDRRLMILAGRCCSRERDGASFGRAVAAPLASVLVVGDIAAGSLLAGSRLSRKYGASAMLGSDAGGGCDSRRAGVWLSVSLGMLIWC